MTYISAPSYPSLRHAKPVSGVPNNTGRSAIAFRSIPRGAVQTLDGLFGAFASSGVKP